ncbi:MAG: hypothetical protein OEV78_12255 [Spirochaetia bacterium]|nr:hypothetical protein [Spirochaetia bacterium]
MNISYKTETFQTAFAGHKGENTFHSPNNHMTSTLLTAEYKIEISKISNKIRSLLKI